MPNPLADLFNLNFKCPHRQITPVSLQDPRPWTSFRLGHLTCWLNPPPLLPQLGCLIKITSFKIHIQNSGICGVHFYSPSCKPIPRTDLFPSLSRWHFQCFLLLGLKPTELLLSSLSLAPCPPQTCQQNLLALPLIIHLELSYYPFAGYYQPYPGHHDLMPGLLESLLINPISTLPFLLNQFSTLQKCPLQNPKTDHVTSVLYPCDGSHFHSKVLLFLPPRSPYCTPY